MFPIFHAMLAAILGTGASAAPAPHVPSGAKRSTLPVVTYGASALGQPAGGVEEGISTTRNNKLKTELKIDKQTTNKDIKLTKHASKTVKLKVLSKVGADWKDSSADKHR